MNTAVWPRSINTALCLTFDIDADTMWTSIDPENERRVSLMSQSVYEITVGIPLVLELLRANGIRTTFFVPGWVAETYPDVIRRIHAEGHEIGAHGWLHESPHRLSRDAERDLIRRTKEALIDVTGEAPVGYRAPLAEVNPQTWEILLEEGFTYSSNMCDSLWPYVRPAGENGRLVELPIHWTLDDGPYFLYSRTPPNYRQFFPPSAVSEIWEAEFDGIADLGGITVLVMHPQLIARPSRLKIIERLLDRARGRQGVWFPTLREVAELQVGGTGVS